MEKKNKYNKREIRSLTLPHRENQNHHRLLWFATIRVAVAFHHCHRWLLNLSALELSLLLVHGDTLHLEIAKLIYVSLFV